MRTASRLITEASNRCVATRRQIEAGLFMWGYDVLGEEPQSFANAFLGTGLGVTSPTMRHCWEGRGEDTIGSETESEEDIAFEGDTGNLPLSGRADCIFGTVP